MTHHCDHCDIRFSNPRCPRCGGPPSRAFESAKRRHPTSRNVSEDDDRVDDMVQQASRPTLASLVKAGLKRGLIQPVHDYASKIK
jgi:hypothetical protein